MNTRMPMSLLNRYVKQLQCPESIWALTLFTLSSCYDDFKCKYYSNGPVQGSIHFQVQRSVRCTSKEIPSLICLHSCQKQLNHLSIDIFGQIMMYINTYSQHLMLIIYIVSNQRNNTGITQFTTAVGHDTYVDLIVMQRSCSSFRVSVNRVSPARAEAMMPAFDTSESVRVDFP